VSATVALQVLNLLQVIHTAGRVHRDIRPDNLLFHPRDAGPIDDDLMVIDWAFSCGRNEMTAYCGATHFVSPAVAEHLIARAGRAGPAPTFCYTATDDVHSWLRVCVFMFNRVSMSAALSRLDRITDLGKKQRLVQKMFDDELASSTWRLLWDAVNALEERDPRVFNAPPAGVFDYTHLRDLIPLRRQRVYAME
jgi:serine/threonine protein kinase